MYHSLLQLNNQQKMSLKIEAENFTFGRKENVKNINKD
jgi:hypothetical protein